MGAMSVLTSLRALFSRNPAAAAIPREPISYEPIGIVRNGVRQSRPKGWQDVRSEIVLRDELAPALAAIEGFSHVIVVFHLDRVPEEARRLRLAVGVDGKERGILATRSQQRPNPIGVAVVPLLARRGAVLSVRGLDALDGTPVLDIKPYLPAYDSVPAARLPSWATEAP
jgi:tRNA-Thr(GGU) m(6)t(6)A37 methyltransferase TsaA